MTKRAAEVSPTLDAVERRDLIDRLVDRKYPQIRSGMSWLYEPSAREGAACYRYQLVKLSTPELERLWRDGETKPVTEIDFRAWGTKPTWTDDEAIELSMGHSPGVLARVHLMIDREYRSRCALVQQSQG